MPTILCGVRVDEATMTMLKDNTPKPYVDVRIAYMLAYLWRLGYFTHN